MRVRMTSRNAGYNAGEIASFSDDAALELIRLGEAEAIREAPTVVPETEPESETRSVERRVRKPARGAVEK